MADEEYDPPAGPDPTRVASPDAVLKLAKLARGFARTCRELSLPGDPTYIADAHGDGADSPFFRFQGDAQGLAFGIKRAGGRPPGAKRPGIVIREVIPGDPSVRLRESLGALAQCLDALVGRYGFHVHARWFVFPLKDGARALTEDQARMLVESLERHATRLEGIAADMEVADIRPERAEMRPRSPGRPEKYPGRTNAISQGIADGQTDAEIAADLISRWPNITEDAVGAVRTRLRNKPTKESGRN